MALCHPSTSPYSTEMPQPRRSKSTGICGLRLQIMGSGESGGVACAVAADDNTVGFRYFASYLVRQQSAYLHHVDVVGGLAALHGFEVGVGHVRVRIDTYI